MNNLWWIPIVLAGGLLLLLLVAVVGITLSFISRFIDDDTQDDPSFIDDFPQF